MADPISTLSTTLATDAPAVGLLANLKSASIWLLWKLEPAETPGKKPRKVPYYVNGKRRQGPLDSPTDRGQLATFDVAGAALNDSNGYYTGLAIALGADGRGGYVQGVDLDDIEANGLSDIANRWVRGDFAGKGYAEESPSGKGMHIIGYGRAFAPLGANGSGIEVYTGGRFFTFTGKQALFDSPCEAFDIAEFAETVLKPRHSRQSDQPRDQIPTTIVAAQVVVELRSALARLRSDDRDLWIRMGMALRELGDDGRCLWLDWSQTSEKYDPRDAARCWESFKPNATGYQAVFAEAQRHGWVNPASNAAQSATCGNSSAGAGQVHSEDWPDPLPLPSSLLPVAAFELSLLPDAFRPWVADIAERMQVPPEFVAVPALVGAGAVIGNQIGIRPMREDDWQVVPNLWGCIVGRPGVLKSPSVSAALAPLGRLEAAANEAYRLEQAAWDASEFEREIRQDARKAAIKKALAADFNADISELRGEPEEGPVCRRYRSNDSTYQALGELLRQNPTGLMVYRDELMSLLSALDREENSEARGFYLSGWNGTDSYVFDRIGRGTNLYIPQVTISAFGSTQPTKLGEYVRRVVSGGASDDGMLQRFGMTVWPDMTKDWQEHDRQPNGIYRQRAFDAVGNLDRLDAAAIGAVEDDFNRGAPYLRFAPDAQQMFRVWRAQLEKRLRCEGLHPALESHLAKYRKLVPALALIHHLTNGNTGSVGLASIEAAIGWAEFLESHAHRIYQSGAAGDVAGAKPILRGLRRGQLVTPFKARDVARKNWTPLGDSGPRVQAAIDLLEDLHYLRGEDVHPGKKGGRPTTIYHANPKLFAC